MSVEALIAILSGHVVQGNFSAAIFISAGCTELETISGVPLSVTAGDDGVVINGGPSVVDANIFGDDGVFHGIDGIIAADGYVACPTPMPSSSFIPSDMPSLVPSDMPSIVPSAMGPDSNPPPSAATPRPSVLEPTAPDTPRGGFDFSSASSLGGLFTMSVATFVAAIMTMV